MSSEMAPLQSWEKVAELHSSLTSMQRADRDALVVSAILLEDGRTEVVSRFGHSTWRLDAYIHGPGVVACEKVIEWATDVPVDMVDDIKAACFAWKQRGRNGAAPPRWKTVRVIAIMGMAFARWLASHGVARFDVVRPVHLANYLHYCRSELQLEPGGLRPRLGIIDLLWRFGGDLQYPMSFVPWDGRTVTEVAGASLTFETALTQIIPRPVQEQIYNHSVAILEQAEAQTSFKVVDRREALRSGAPALRNACLYIISITTGARNDELLGIEVGAYREEVIDGVTYRWIRAIENKTGKGVVEYLCPAIAGRAVRVLERWSQPFREFLGEEIRLLDAQPPTAERDLRLLKARADFKRLFLSVSSVSKWIVATVSTQACRDGLRQLAKDAGVDWRLNPHQTRRTYARMVVESRIGRSPLVFLKWQLKHTTMTMTQGYASNPLADRTLFEEFLDEMAVFKAELLDSWTAQTPLSGGAGRSIVELRATPHANRSALLRSASEHVNVRATGHGWCLSESRGCGGAGLYEATRCVNCKDGVIDPSFSETWRQIHVQQRELLELDDVGPAVRTRAEREVRLSATVLRDLGLSPDEP